MSETNPPAWAVERAREIMEVLRAMAFNRSDASSHYVEEATNAIAAALTVPDGHVRLPSGDQSLPWKVIHVASNEVVASFKWGDVAQTYIKRGIEIGGWHEHELRLHQAAESARSGGVNPA